MYLYVNDKKNGEEGIQMVLLEELGNHEYVTLKTILIKAFNDLQLVLK